MQPDRHDDGEPLGSPESGVTDSAFVILVHTMCNQIWTPDPDQDLSTWNGGRCSVRHPSPPSGYHYPQHTLAIVDVVHLEIPDHVDELWGQS